MEIIATFKVYPAIPEDLAFLDYLARNLWWSWDYEAIELFRRINPAKWEKTNRNPVAFLASLSQRRLRKLARDDSFLDHMARVKNKFERMFTREVSSTELEVGAKETIAYFSMEFGIHESLPFFAGGLGILAGDHLKAASEMNLPLTGVGLFYREGYFRQFLNHEGWQQEFYPENNMFDLPLQKARDGSGREVTVSVPGINGDIKARVWQVKVGRVRLLLLDTNLRENNREIRDITSRLYASEARIRSAQEALLGIGGIKALSALDIFPAVIHLNEGHCAFACLERLHLLMQRYMIDFSTAVQVSKRSSVFTTHTPVVAGHDHFEEQTVLPYVAPYKDKFKVTESEILSWGKPWNEKSGKVFSMFVLGNHFSGYINGVSRLHGQVTRKMWTDLWPQRFTQEIPITHVTNGVHILSYISKQKASLMERYLSSDWAEKLDDPELLARIDDIDSEDFWHAHELDRSKLIRSCRKFLLKQYGLRNAPRNVIEEISTALDHNVLTVCFARRFATYKRADLLLRDEQRLINIINAKDRPVQFIFAGKAHPNDREGKQIIQRLLKFARRHEVRHAFVFIEDYDINVARFMVQGCDVWLNTPRRPNEACGTSGMKAAANGGLNLSVLDGWWCEGYTENRGWAIGDSEVHEDPEYQDSIESRALYNILENEVIPAFYSRETANVPEKWVRMMKEAVKMAFCDYSSSRMLRDYSERCYAPALANMKALTGEGAKPARALAAKQARLESLWEGIEIEKPVIVRSGSLKVGDDIKITAKVSLGELTPEEVAVQVYYGRLRINDQLDGGRTENMEIQETQADNVHVYACRITCEDSGQFGCTVRAIPRGDAFLSNTPGLITWARKR